VICVGSATKISSFLMEAEKEYVGTARLGVTTDTQDADGRVVRERPVVTDDAAIREVATRFVGEIEQVPPMYSAVKVGGEKLYRLARQGREVERAARRVRVHAFEIVGVALPEFEFVLRCSKGTYVRTILHDLGEALGCGAHLARLVRERQGAFRREAAITWEQLLEDGAGDVVRAAGVSQEAALDFLPALDVPGAVSGQPPVGTRWDDAGAPAAGGTVRLVRGGRTVALGRREGGSVRVVHVLPGSDRFGRRPRR
jgi:tRNA pseudouridine55 synthase